MRRFDRSEWALVLGGSSGIGLATAHALAEAGMSVCVVHRDRRGAMGPIDEAFARIRRHGGGFLALNLDALAPAGVDATLAALRQQLGERGALRLFLHSIAFGNLKPVAPPAPERGPAAHAERALNVLAAELSVAPSLVADAVARALDRGAVALGPLRPPAPGAALLDDEDVARTVYAMGTSLLTWTQRLFAERLFANDARVIALTSEGNTVAWRGYAAVAAAKCALESVCRAIAVEFGPHGIRANVVQAGVTDTPALRLIPGGAQMRATAMLRNPLGRLTTPEDVANAIVLLARDEARWINGALLHVDGGEHHAPA